MDLIAGVNSVVLEVQGIDLLFAIHYHVQFMRLKDREQLLRNCFIKTVFQIVNTFTYAIDAVMLKTIYKQVYRRVTYYSLLEELSIISKPLSLRGVTSSFPSSSKS